MSVHTCVSGQTCMLIMQELESYGHNNHPILVILGSRSDDDASQQPVASSDYVESYGISLLQHLSSERSKSSLSKLVIPIAMIHQCDDDPSFTPSPNSRASRPASGTISQLAVQRSSSPRRQSPRITAAESEVHRFWSDRCP